MPTGTLRSSGKRGTVQCSAKSLLKEAEDERWLLPRPCPLSPEVAALFGITEESVDMSRKTSRHRFSGTGGVLSRAVAVEIKQDRQAAMVATGPGMAAVRMWQDHKPVDPLSADELLREMKRLADKRGFRLKKTRQ
jgi:hypothetical protein